MLGSSDCLCNKLLYLILYKIFSVIGPHILFSTLLSGAYWADSEFLVKNKLSLACHNTDLIKVSDSFIFIWRCIKQDLMRGYSEKYIPFARWIFLWIPSSPPTFVLWFVLSYTKSLTSYIVSTIRVMVWMYLDGLRLWINWNEHVFKPIFNFYIRVLQCQSAC
jgi:hypothetical protein